MADRAQSLMASLVAVAACAGMGSAQAEIRFVCPGQAHIMRGALAGYLSKQGIRNDQVHLRVDSATGTLSAALTTPLQDTSTLDFHLRSDYALSPDLVQLPDKNRGWRTVSTVSKKEIVLALLQHGRRTEFSGSDCALTSLADYVGIRQNLVAWSENLSWEWPDGGYAKWNNHFWHRGTPKAPVDLHAALMDAFHYQEKYSIGCYTATKLVVVQAFIDYYRRVRPDPIRALRIETALLSDGEPLQAIEPARMWSFERDFNHATATQPGKLVVLTEDVAAKNFVPGDWAYFVNTDLNTSEKTGYEGSNAIYLGQNRFDDFYNDHQHSYTYEQKLDEVFQWRNGVFSRLRDRKKHRILSSSELAQLSNTPQLGGLQMSYRAVPRRF